MNHVICYIGGISLTWHGIVMAIAVAAAVAVSAVLAGERKNMLLSVLSAASISCLLSTFFSKFVYWYCCYERFNGFGDALTRVGEGGHSLVGAMAGVILSALIAALIIKPDGGFMGLLDCIAPGGALGICIGRLASYFSLSDKGNILITDPADQHAPLAFEVIDSVTGTAVWRFSTFFFESAAAAIIFVCCAYMYFTFCGAGTKPERTGSVAMIFLSLFGASQAVLESTRYDALYLRSNGFVSLMQIISLLMIILSMVYFSLITVRAKGVKPLYYVLWGVTLALLGVCGYMEYYVQRHADMYVMCYTVMSCAMAVCVGITLFFCINAGRPAAQQPEEE